MRAVLVGHMMYHWRNSRHRVLKSVLWLSVLFGVLHIGNAFANPMGTTFQIFYAGGIGVMFAAAYIRTRNLRSCVLVHAAVDFSSGITSIFVPVQADGQAYVESAADLTYFLPSCAPQAVLASWGVITILVILVETAPGIGAGIFMLRRSRAEEIAGLRADM